MYDMNYIDKIIKTYQENVFCYGGVSEVCIRRAEDSLAIRLPEDYIEFLKRYGALEFGSLEIYGLVEPETEGIPNMVWITSVLREKYGLPSEYAGIGFDGFGGYYCLVPEQRNAAGGYPVAVYNVTGQSEEIEIIAWNFSEFLFQQLKEEARNL